jgi:thioredoxin-related protein
MKKVLSTFVFVMLLAVVSLTAQCCNSSEKKSDKSDLVMANKSAEISNVEVYYFHLTRRCITCKSVEENIKLVVKELYGEDIPFSSVNWQENRDHEIIQRHHVGGQCLLITKGEKSVDLTSFAFMNVRNIEKLKERVKETVESF